MKLLKNKKIEDQYSYPDFQTSDGEPASLEILDTAGQEEYSVMHDQWIREGGAFIILFSLDEKSTFDNALAMRKKIERAKDAEDFPMVLVGNKAEWLGWSQLCGRDGWHLRPFRLSHLLPAARPRRAREGSSRVPGALARAARTRDVARW